jgi:hypothetical protein
MNEALEGGLGVGLAKLFKRGYTVRWAETRTLPRDPVECRQLVD